MKKKIFFLVVLLVLVLLISYNIIVVTQFAQQYVYPLDDAYIHLSMAKNFADYGVWGITSREFSSTTSSPLFTFILSIIIKFFGNWEYIPLVLNIVAALTLLLVLNKSFKKYSSTTYLILMLLVVVLMPLHLMVMTGMEHVIHALAMVLVLQSFQSYLENNSPRRFSILAMLCIMAVGFRYESLFFILFICIYLFFIKKDYTKSFALGIISLLPVFFYGWISIQEGSYFLPNSLILKGNTNDGVIGFLTRVTGNAYRGLSIIILILILLALSFYKRKRISFFERMKNSPLILVVLGGFSLHLLFANFGWLIRYESYLVVLLLFVTAPFINNLINNFKTNKAIGLYVFALFSVVFAMRFVNLFFKQEVSSKNIYEQQIQAAKFIHQYYPNSKIIANDIGAITYFNNIQLLDTYGLGSIEVARLRKNDHGEFLDNKNLRNYIYNTAKIDNFDMAVVYDSWVKMPNQFVKVGELSIPDNYICGDSTISFYSVNPDNADKLRNQLKEFSKKVPKDVIVNIIN